MRQTGVEITDRASFIYLPTGVTNPTWNCKRSACITPIRRTIRSYSEPRKHRVHAREPRLHLPASEMQKRPLRQRKSGCCILNLAPLAVSAAQGVLHINVQQRDGQVVEDSLRNSLAESPEPVDPHRELCGFLALALKASKDVLEQSLTIQRDTMDVISLHIMSTAGDRSSTAMSDVIGAMQADDLLRQRHENLVRAFGAMVACATKAEAGFDTDQLEAVDASRRQWRRSLLEAFTLEDIRDDFERSLSSNATADTDDANRSFA